MKLKYLLCILIFFEIIILFILRGISYSQTGSESNLNNIDKLLDESLIPVENELLLLGNDKIYNLSVEYGTENPEQQSYLIALIKRKFSGYKILINADTVEFSDSINYNLFINNPSLNTRYLSIYTDNVLGTKKIKREISVSYSVKISDSGNSSVVFAKDISKKLVDSFNIDDQNVVEDKRYSFSRSNLPEENSLNQLIYPAVIILASAVAIILFFTIRSK
ncbi:MAG TPA: hypothetical protein PKD83_00155 [Ignavibacteria bacterium]|nr:hypothetical protein [Ignavibacteria bacterium]